MTERHIRSPRAGRRRTRIRLATALAGMALLAGCGDTIEPGVTESGPAKSVSARVAEAHIRTQPFIYEAVGTVTPRTASTIASKLMGTVTAVQVQEGDRFKKGEVLVVLDQRQVSAQLRQAEAALAEARRAEASARSAQASAKAAAELARSTLERYLQLKADDSVSQQEFDEVAARNRQAQAVLTQTTAMLEAAGYRVQQALAGVSGARVSKTDATVEAPYDGRITAKLIDVGDLASPGTPLFGIEKDGVYCADLVLPEQHIESIRLDQTVRVTLPALNHKILTGRIGRIVPAADARSRTFQVKVALPEDTQLRSGMFARIEIPVGEAGMLLIPSSAVVRRGQLTGIYRVDAEQTARFRLIRVGKTIGDTVEVLSGLTAGDRFVVSPTPEIVDGVRVETPS